MTDHNELAARIERAEGPDRARQELTSDEWRHMAAVMWRWPSMGFCTAAAVQPFITAAAIRARSAS